MTRKIAIFSGRFDPPNLGHILAVLDMMVEYSAVLIIVLDSGSRFYRKREACTARQAKAIFDHWLSLTLPTNTRNKVEVIINRDHFGYITKVQFLKLMKQHGIPASHCEYVAGNEDVLEHVEGLGIMPCVRIPRVNIKGAKLDQYIFESTNIRQRMRRRKSTLGQEYNIG